LSDQISTTTNKGYDEGFQMSLEAKTPPEPEPEPPPKSDSWSQWGVWKLAGAKGWRSTTKS